MAVSVSSTDVDRKPRSCCTITFAFAPPSKMVQASPTVSKAPSTSGQVTTLSRSRHGFESRRGHQVGGVPKWSASFFIVLVHAVCTSGGLSFFEGQLPLPRRQSPSTSRSRSALMPNFSSGEPRR